MEFVYWLLLQAVDHLWGEMEGMPRDKMDSRTTGMLDTIHVLNEIVTWMKRTNYGANGVILPVATIDRQAFYDVLNVTIGCTIGTLEEWESTDVDGLHRDMVTFVVALDSVASRVCAPYYVSRMAKIASLVPADKEATSDGTGHRSTVADDDGQRGNDSAGD